MGVGCTSSLYTFQLLLIVFVLSSVFNTNLIFRQSDLNSAESDEISHNFSTNCGCWILLEHV